MRVVFVPFVSPPTSWVFLNSREQILAGLSLLGWVFGCPVEVFRHFIFGSFFFAPCYKPRAVHGPPAVARCLVTLRMARNRANEYSGPGWLGSSCSQGSLKATDQGNG